MHAPVTREFRMKGADPHPALFGEHRTPIVLCEHDHRVTYPFDGRCADEHPRKIRAVESGNPQVGLEGIALTAVRVAPRGQIDGTQRGLIGTAVEHLSGEEDEAGTRAEHRQPVADRVLQRVDEAGRRQQVVHGGGFTAGHDERVHAVETLRGADLDHGDTQ